MKKFELLAATALVVLLAFPANAQTTEAAPARDTAPANTSGGQTGRADINVADIIVTAQRHSQRLQNVPIAMTAFTSDSLAKQQIVNSSALQQSLPSITFTKTNFSSSAFNIRGIGDLCGGPTCDTATGIHVNDMPVLETRLFESEFFDLERIEVLRGPQGTLFGRNATSGVVNFISAKPDLSKTATAGEIEYGNYDSKRVKGMLNLPITSTVGVRLSGIYLKRDGYTSDTYTGNRIDGRDLYSVRGTLSWKPDADTRVDLIGYYFHERDNRSRIQKQLCHRDPTGVLGCLPDRLGYETSNGNASLTTLLSSNELFAVRGGATLRPLGLASIYGNDIYAGVVNPADVRTVNADFEPTYFTKEEQYTAKIFHDFGPVSLSFTGGYMRSAVDARTDYNLAVEGSLASSPGLNLLNTAGRTGQLYAFLNGVRQALIPNGPTSLCQSDADSNNVGVYGGNAIGCFPQSLDFDRAVLTVRQYSAEAHIDSKFDGPFNFLLGGIYFNSRASKDGYYVNGFGLDYASGILGAASSLTAAPSLGGNAFLATPFYRSEYPAHGTKSFGIFGETYYALSDKLKLTLGVRYNNDRKFLESRNLTLTALTPIGSANITDSPFYATTDYDPITPGVQEFRRADAKFSRVTGRAVLDYRITDNNMLYASYSRGYKSGGINPALPASFNIPVFFGPETLDAFEIGSKNTFMDGQLRLNLTGFYYKYKNLQFSRVVGRQSVNDNADADIYGAEAEIVIAPTRAFVINANASYLHTKVATSKLLVDTRDPSGGRADAVIIKDITNGSNCAVVSAAGNAAATNGFVSSVNNAINAGAFAANGVRGGAGLRGPTAIPGMAATGAYGICSVLSAAAAAGPASGISALDGVPTDIRGNKLPQAPTYKVSIGMQYTYDVDHSGWTVVPRVDLNYTGEFYGRIFNTNADRISGYTVLNAQIQASAPDDRFYLRAFIQNLTNNDAITGQYVTDQSSGLYTNIFTLEPRRYGLAAGFKF